MSHRRVLTALAVAALVVVTAACGDDDSASGSTTSTTTTTTSSTTTSTTQAPASAQVVWPPADGSISYTDPVEAATGFAVDLVGFTDPVVGEFQAGDARSGEVVVRAAADGPATIVLVRQVGSDDTWSVLGATTEQIQPEQPAPGAEVSSPVRLGGTSTAFEGTVQVAVHARRSGDPLGTGFVTGGSMGEMGPFEGTVEFGDADTADGSIVYTTVSMEDGRVWQAAVVPVAFAAR